MPQPNKKRGRRMENKKRKLEDEADADPELAESSTKRRKSVADQGDGMWQYGPAGEHASQDDGSLDPAYPDTEDTFFGVLDVEEQEYFKRADDMLEANSFGDDEEKKLFLANVYREAQGKELKIAQSQSCSRLMERLIQFSTPVQLKALFQSFSGRFVALIQHRFSSHCCEALFMRAAPAVTSELLAGEQTVQGNAAPLTNGDVVDVSMESLYLQVLAELRGRIGFLLTQRHASHVLRMLLLVLAGEPIGDASTKHLLRSKRKEDNTIPGVTPEDVQTLARARSVPKSFGEALETVIAESIAGLDTDKVRSLATHPNGNPSLQLLLQLELAHYGKSRGRDEDSIIRTLLPDHPITADSGSAKFITGLVYDPIGSHLVEKIVEHAPAKMFKSLYAEFFRERLAQHARSEIAGYVVCRVLERLSQDDLHIAHEELIPAITGLLQRGRTMVVRTLIERCTVRDIDTKAIAVQVNNTWDTPEGFEVRKLLKWGYGLDVEPNMPQESLQSSAASEAAAAYFARSSEPIKAHFNILAQTMLLVPGSLSSLVLDSLITLDPETLIAMSQDTIVSRTIQAAMTTRNASLITIRKLIQRFYGHMGEMSLDKGASHVVDCMWEGTHGLAFIRERIAEELAENENDMRESSYGRAVWKNWKMDLYKRRRNDWIRQSKIKASNDGFQSFSELDAVQDKEGAPKKTPLELARERHAKNRDKEKKDGRKKSNSTPSVRPGAPNMGEPSNTTASPTNAPTAATAST